MKLARIYSTFFIFAILVGLCARVDANEVTIETDGLKGPLGIAYQAQENAIYIVENPSGELEKLDLKTKVLTPIATGLDKPLEIVLHPLLRQAYITTSDGKIFLQSLDDSNRQLIVDTKGNLGQMVIDFAKFMIFVTDSKIANQYDKPKIRIYSLRTGEYFSSYVSLERPSALQMDRALKYAYVKNSSDIIRVDMTSDRRTQQILLHNTTDCTTLPFHFVWANEAQTALYYARSCTEEIGILDLSTPTPASRIVAKNLGTISSTVLGPNENTLYVASGSKILKVVLSALSSY